jgi:hypothetical protein
MLMIASGYEDGNDASALRSDPAFKLAQDTLPSGPDLASQPTISRLENLPDVRSLLRMGRAFVDLFCASYARVPNGLCSISTIRSMPCMAVSSFVCSMGIMTNMASNQSSFSMATDGSWPPCCDRPSVQRA